MPIKTTMKYHFTPTGMARIPKKMISAGEDVGKFFIHWQGGM